MKYYLLLFLSMTSISLSAQQSLNNKTDNGILQTSETVESFLDELDNWHGVPFFKGEKNKDNGVDAAGLICYVYRNVFNLTLPSTADSIWEINIGKRIAIFDEDLLPGDIIFFQSETEITDAVIYIGDEDGENIIRVHPKNGVQSAKLQDIKGRMAGAKRFVNFTEPIRQRSSGYLLKPVESAITKEDLLNEINTWIGTPYEWGNNKKQTGTDCSGFVTSVYRTLFNITLPRTSAAMWTDPIGEKIDDTQFLRPGDVLFFKYGNRIGHVAIYIGKNKQGSDQIVHAKNEKEPLGIDLFNSGSYWMKQYTGAKRFVILSEKKSSGETLIASKTKKEDSSETAETLYRSSQTDVNSVSIIKGKNQLSITWIFKSGATEKQIAKQVIDKMYHQTFSEKYPDPVFYRYEYIWKNEKHIGTILEDQKGVLRAEIDENQETEEIEIFTLTQVHKSAAGTKKAVTAKMDTVSAVKSDGTDLFQTGEASYYAHQFHGRKTANGEIYDMNQLTAAHRSLPFGTKLKITNLQNRRQIEVRVNDRGPFVKGRIIDVSYEAAKQLDMIRSGVADVTIELLD